MSTERGLNVNTNGLVRQYIQKSNDLAIVTAAQVARLQDVLNARPCKTLNVKSPNEVVPGRIAPLPKGRHYAFQT